MNTVEESDVGISCYISQLPGFSGILKQRYSDFIVNEVDLDDNVVHLTSFDVPPELIEEKEVKISDQQAKDYTAEIESFRALAGDSDAESLKTLIDQINCSAEENDTPIILSPSSDKSHRTAIHNFFKENLKFLVTDTVDGPESSSKCIRVRLNSGGNNGRGKNSKKRKERGGKPYDSRGSDNWSDHTGKFLRFNLFKENKDTQEVLGVIGKMLGIQPRSFGFSGTKDKRSVSTQRVTVYKQHASKLASLNKRLIGIKVGDFCYVKEGLLLGQLHGNRFTITLRGVLADSDDIIKASANALGEHGFINYFGLQRFGSGSVPTHSIGAKLLKGEWQAAVNMILDPREGEKDSTRVVREYYKESNDIDGTLRQLPRHLVSERAILQCLKKFPGNYLQALKSIPRTLRMMYVHSYQSYLWNHAASFRVQKYGHEQVVLGDLVYNKDQNEPIKPGSTFNESVEENNDIDDNALLIGAVDDEIPEFIHLSEETSSVVKAVTEEDLISGNYMVEDVLLPLPGSRVIYPRNEIEKVYQDLTNKDSISLTNTVHSIKEFSLTNMTGAYRRVFQKPKDFRWEVLNYIDGNIPLAETDLDVIAKKAESVSDCKPGVDGLENNNNKSNTEGLVQKALKMSFTLPASCYATMAIRELLKTSTSVNFEVSDRLIVDSINSLSAKVVTAGT